MTVRGKLSETSVLVQVRLEASRQGIITFRNNSGVLKNERGVPIRFGLSNESAAVNKMCKSSDLIGIKPVVVTQAMVGTTVGVFWAREIKEPLWKYTGGEREQAQKRFIDLINQHGGDAAFATNGSNT